MVEKGSPTAGSALNKKDSAQFIGFRLADQEYAFRIEQIQEIVILDQVTQTPQVADYIEGVANLRGTIIPIVNLRQLFGFQPKPLDDETRTVVVNVGERTMGCTVDSVTQVIRILTTQIQPAPEMVTSAGNAYISGLAKLDERLVIILDVDKLLNPEKLDFDRQSE